MIPELWFELLDWMMVPIFEIAVTGKEDVAR